MDKVVLCETLLKWLQTFNIQAPHSTVQDISDGVAMSQVLAQISPDVFDETWLSKIKTDTSNNWRIKVSNLKKICQGIVDYYQESLAENIVDFSLPDVSRIGEYNDAAELGRMLQLILGCAIKCETKQKYIQTIMGMEESVQRMIMNAIKELLDKETVAAGGGPPTPDPSLSATELMVMDSNIKRLMDDLEAMSEAKEKMAQRCHDLDMQVALLRNEKANLQLENDQLQRRLQELEVVEDASLGGQRYKELKKQLEGLQQEVFKLETSRDDSRSKVEILERDLAELEARNEELQRAADESRGLKDELDVLRDSAERAAKYETTIEGYKKKLEEYADLKKQVRLLEEKNTNYMQQTMELEEELKKSGTWRPQLDLYKKQVAELNHRLGEESKKADKASFESVKMQEKLAALLREKECLMTERDRLRESNEELKCTQLQIGSATHPPLPTLTPDSGNRTASSLSETADILEMIPPEIKERFIRLQHENKILRLNQQSPNKDGDSQPVLQAMIDGLNQRESELQSENRLANQRILQLESQLEEIQEHGDGKKLDNKGSDNLARLEELELKLKELTQHNVMLQETLNQQKSEIQVMENKQRRYLDKAKQVIRQLDPKSNLDEVSLLQAKLVDKDKAIEHMEQETEKTRQIRDMEEKLIASAFYNYTSQMNRQAVEQRLLHSHPPGQSFLSRQRQATARRTNVNLGGSEFYDY